MERIDQLLFGYGKGHELIAASRTLSASQQREVLPHTDANFERLDERQLVGAAVPSLDGYLLARIWPAPERPRLGAVWAHALLLSADQLRTGSLSGLLGLLRCPDGRTLDAYRERLPWPTERQSLAGPAQLVRALATAAGTQDARPRVVLWPAPADAEGALVALLDACPAGMRGHLSFRTRERVRPGSSSYRLQVAASLSGQSTGAAHLVIDPRAEPAAA
jgi:hypothetical protein